VLSRWAWVRGGATSSEGVVVKVRTPPTPKPSPQPVTEATKQPRETAITKKAKPQKAEPKITAASKAASVEPIKVASTVAKYAMTATRVAKPHSTTYSPEDNSDFFDSLTLEACVELTRRFLTSVSPLLPRAKNRLWRPASRFHRGRGNIRGCSARVYRRLQARWSTQAYRREY
jgi:hypothetical protein